MGFGLGSGSGSGSGLGLEGCTWFHSSSYSLCSESRAEDGLGLGIGLRSARAGKGGSCCGGGGANDELRSEQLSCTSEPG